MKRTHEVALRAFLLAGLAVTPAQELGAQAVGSSSSYPDLDRRHDEALAIVASSTRFRESLEEATRRHARVVEERTEDDARRFFCLYEHAGLVYGLGDTEEARAYMERAAEHARATGDVYNAARAFVDAAILAAKAGDAAAASRLAEEARLLTLSPHLGPQEQALILERLGSHAR